MNSSLLVIQHLTENFSTHQPEWLLGAILAYQAGVLTRKQKRKLKWRLVWGTIKSKFPFRKKAKGKGVSVGGILLLLVCVGLTGLIFALGGTVWGIVAAVCTLLVAGLTLSAKK